MAVTIAIEEQTCQKLGHGRGGKLEQLGWHSKCPVQCYCESNWLRLGKSGKQSSI